jgi:erythromycin esterase
MLASLILATAGASWAQQLTPDERSVLGSAAVDLDPSKAASWSAIAEAIGDRRVVLLGEFTHGTGEVQAVRNELIRFLHESLGFDVLLLETGIGEIVYSDARRDVEPARTLLNAILYQWRNEQWLQTMELVKELKLETAGFDVQRSNDAFTRVLTDWGEASGVDAVPYLELEEFYYPTEQRLKNEPGDAASLAAGQLIAAYEELAAASLEVDDPRTRWVSRTLTNRSAYLRYKLAFSEDGDYSARFDARDAAMADNVRWLLEGVYADRKVIVIGHNYHVSRFNENLEVMGELLARSMGESLYSVGAFGASGSYHDNGGKARAMTPPSEDALDVKHFSAALGPGSFFVPVNEATRELLSREAVVNDSFIDLSKRNHLVPSRHFDALILIDEVAPPVTLH